MRGGGGGGGGVGGYDWALGSGLLPYGIDDLALSIRVSIVWRSGSALCVKFQKRFFSTQ